MLLFKLTTIFERYNIFVGKEPIDFRLCLAFETHCFGLIALLKHYHEICPSLLTKVSIAVRVFMILQTQHIFAFLLQIFDCVSSLIE